MRRMARALAFALVTLTLPACTPWFYGGVVVFGPAENGTGGQGTTE
jgi:hypothetical protein